MHQTFYDISLFLLLQGFLCPEQPYRTFKWSFLMTFLTYSTYTTLVFLDISKRLPKIFV